MGSIVRAEAFNAGYAAGKKESEDKVEKLQQAYEKLIKFVEEIAETQGGSWIECDAPREAQELLDELSRL